jgi:hypothetical protein
MGRRQTASFLAAMGALAALTALTPLGGAMASGGPASTSAAKNCVGKGPAAKKRNNVEAIIDDSFSMKQSDPNRLRLTGVQLFISDPGNARKRLGVVEFGTQADTVFGPTVIGPNRNVMRALLRQHIKADNDQTNYDAGFQKAAADNPAADARVFVTDGADDGTYANSHRGGPPTFVVGLGIGRPGPGNPAANRLQQIANETGGRYFPRVEDSTLQPTFRRISAALSCQPKPRTFRSGRFHKKTQSSTRTVRLGSATKRIELDVNWANPKNRFFFSRVELLTSKGRVLANLTGKGKPRKIRAKRSGARTYSALEFKKAAGAKRLRFTVKPRTLKRGERTITLLSERE